MSLMPFSCNAFETIFYVFLAQTCTCRVALWGYSHFAYAESCEQLNLFFGTKAFSWYICYEVLTKYSRVKRRTTDR